MTVHPTLEILVEAEASTITAAECWTRSSIWRWALRIYSPMATASRLQMPRRSSRFRYPMPGSIRSGCVQKIGFRIIIRGDSLSESMGKPLIPSLALTIWTGAGCLHYPGDKKYDFRLTAWTWDERAGKDYDIPFRSLYSKNIKNLMMAGKHISVTYVAGSSTKLVGNGSQHAIVDGCCRPSVQPISKTAPRYRYESHAGASDRYCWHHWSGLWQRE